MSEENRYRINQKYLVIGIAVIAVVLALLGVLSMIKQSYLKKATKEKAAMIQAGQRVRVITTRRSGGLRSITLSGEANPYASVTLYSKVSGYLREIRVDKGDRVKAGQVLAVIESPEVDRQYEANLADAQNKRAEAARAKELVKKGYIPVQDAETAEATAKIAEMTAEAAKIQKEYETIRAPFSATVTARFADPGALVQSATTQQTAALPVVTLSQTDKLRVYVYLDQKNAVFVHVGDQAEVFDAARTEVRLSASVSRVSGELDQKTRTLLTEIDLDNRNEQILAGSSVQVTLKLKITPSIEIPANALMTKDDKTRAGVITSENRVHFKPVIVLESDGKIVRLSSGLEEGERVVLNPGFEISEGEQIQPVEATF
jgi:membrane fusion protein (multidrug efflux system)